MTSKCELGTYIVNVRRLAQELVLEEVRGEDVTEMLKCHGQESCKEKLENVAARLIAFMMAF